MQGDVIALKRFVPTAVQDGKICVIIGKRGTGKTVLAKDILYYKRRIPAGICCSGTEEGNHWYSTFIPDTFVYGDFDRAAVQRLVDRQRSLRKKGHKTNVFLILDDCLYNKKVLQEKVIRELFFNGRHWGIFLIITAQWMLSLAPDLRCNIDYVFILREPIRANRERLYKSLCGIFPTFDAFNKAMDVVTADYGCLVIDNASKSNDISNVAFWYKANPERNFRMGSKAFWNFHSSNYDPEYDERPPHAAEENDKKKKSLIVLKKR